MRTRSAASIACFIHHGAGMGSRVFAHSDSPRGQLITPGPPPTSTDPPMKPSFTVAPIAMIPSAGLHILGASNLDLIMRPLEKVITFQSVA